MLFSIILSIIIFILFFFLEISLRLLNLRKTINPFNIFILSNIFFIFISIISNIIFIKELILDRYLVSLIYYNLYTIFYLHLFIGIAKSVSLRSMDEIYYFKQKMTIDQLKQAYSSNDFFDHRIELLIKNKWLISTDNNIKCSNKGLFLVKVNLFFLKLFKISDTG